MAQFLRNRSARERQIAAILTVSNVPSLYHAPFTDHYKKRGDRASGSHRKTHTDTVEKSDDSDDEGQYSGTDGEEQESDNEMESETEEWVKPKMKKTNEKARGMSKSKVNETKKTKDAKVNFTSEGTKSNFASIPICSRR